MSIVQVQIPDSLHKSLYDLLTGAKFLMIISCLFLRKNCMRFLVYLG
jgi:hypothetical protein